MITTVLFVLAVAWFVLVPLFILGVSLRWGKAEIEQHDWEEE